MCILRLVLLIRRQKPRSFEQKSSQVSVQRLVSLSFHLDPFYIEATGYNFKDFI